MFNRSEMEFRFGRIVNGIWVNESVFMRVYHLPQWAERNRQSIYTHQAMFDPLEKALVNLKKANLLDEIHSYDGCFNVRKVRGDDSKWSTHSWGLALDLNAAMNQLGTPGDMTLEFVQCWKDAGFFWGGDYTRNDPMHFTIVDEAN